jgi:hypothetical protein
MHAAISGGISECSSANFLSVGPVSSSVAMKLTSELSPL